MASADAAIIQAHLMQFFAYVAIIAQSLFIRDKETRLRLRPHAILLDTLTPMKNRLHNRVY